MCVFSHVYTILKNGKEKKEHAEKGLVLKKYSQTI